MKRRLCNKITWHLSLVFLLFYGIPFTQGAITVHTDLNTWRNELPSYMTETFNDIVLEPGVSVNTVNGQIASFLWSDRVTLSGETTTWIFTNPINAWGADFWNVATPGGIGTGLQVYIDGITVPSEIPNTQTSGFWGITSTTSFTQVLITAGTQSQDATAESFYMDNMSYSTVPVPEPSAVILSAIGVTFAGWFKKFKTIM